MIKTGTDTGTTEAGESAVRDAVRDAVRAEARRVFRTEARALEMMAEAPPEGLERAVALIRQAPGRVVVSGMGKSGHVARKIAATFASTGTPALFLHPAEASHGDLGMVSAGDVCILLSNSGETRELSDLIAYARRFSIPLIAITKAADSALARQADVVLLLPDAPEACPIGMAPTTSTTASMALGDALAMVAMAGRGFQAEAFQVFHPGGKLGAQFIAVRQIMYSAGKVPLVAEETPMSEAVLVMTSGGFGVAGVCDAAGRLVGVVSDGDLRRNMAGLLARTAGDICTRAPVTVAPGALAAEAMAVMTRAKIGALFVCDAGVPVGVLHLHDLLRVGVM